MQATAIITAFAIIIAFTEARSLTDLVSDHHREKRSPGEEDDEEWIPPPGVNGEDWYKCHGMPCEQWNRTSSKVMELFRMTHPDEAVPTSDYTWAFDVVGSTHDGSLDGCIYLTEEQADELIQNMKEEANEHSDGSSHSRKKRKLTNFRGNSFGKWDRFPIAYKFDGKHTSSERKLIRSAFQHWMDQTCVTFREASTNEFVRSSHILLTRNSTGCHSYVGRVPLTPQQINLQHNCLWEFGIPVHEIGHALGFWHEQQRYDRDNTIRVLYQNLGYYKGQFARVKTESLGVPYDVGSVMHYAPKDGSSNGRPTMETIDPLYQNTMGQKTGLSFLDAMIINRAYCSDRCRGVYLPRKCERHGYQDPLACNQCRCPPGFGGRFCEIVATPKGDWCGGSLTVSTTTQTISSPGYPSRSYQNRQECNWLIKAPRGYQVQLRFVDEFSVYCHNQNQCHHWVEVQYNDEVGLPGPRFCCYRTPKSILTSTNGEMAVVFRSNWTSPYVRTRIGFKAEIVAVPSDGSDPQTPPTPTTTTLRTPPPTPPVDGPSSEIWSCNFETGSNRKTWCGMVQDRGDIFDWTIQEGRTPSQETGPDYPYNGQWFIYIEASNTESKPRRKNDYARIFLPYLKSEGYHCVHFNYHMYGFHINELQLVKDGSKGLDTIWNKKGQQGNKWFSTMIEVYLSRNDRLGFNGIRGSEFSGDIALDALRVTSGRC